MAVALATIRTNIYTTLYNHLQTGTYALSTNNIHPVFKRLERVQERYPQVIITAPLVAIEQLTMGSTKVYSCPFTVMFEIYHSSSVNVKALSDELTNKIITGVSVLQAAGMKRISFEQDDLEVEDHSAIDATHIIRLTLVGVYTGAT